MKVSVLGSGSAGNASLVWAGETKILVDAGFSGVSTAKRLDMIGVDPDHIDAIVVTHDHGDHTKGVGVFSRRHGTPIYMTARTRASCERLLRGSETVVEYEAARPFGIGDLLVQPFVTVHDAADPVGVTVSCGRTGLRLGIATDLGRPTAQSRHALSSCDLLILEANHDEVLLHTSRYPATVRNRIASSHGHLSNQAAARLATELLHPRLAGVLLAHLSAECNRPDLALEVVGGALQAAGWKGHIEVVGQDHPTVLFDIEALRARTGPSQLSLL